MYRFALFIKLFFLFEVPENILESKQTLKKREYRSQISDYKKSIDKLNNTRARSLARNKKNLLRKGN